MVELLAYQAGDRGSNPGERIFYFIISFLSIYIPCQCNKSFVTVHFKFKITWVCDNKHKFLWSFVEWYLCRTAPLLDSRARPLVLGERGGSVVECRTPEREVRGSKPTAAVLCPWARHFTPRKYWLITQEAMAPSRHDWKIVDWDVKPQHNQPTLVLVISRNCYFSLLSRFSFL